MYELYKLVYYQGLCQTILIICELFAGRVKIVFPL